MGEGGGHCAAANFLVSTGRRHGSDCCQRPFSQVTGGKRLGLGRQGTGKEVRESEGTTFQGTLEVRPCAIFVMLAI